MRVHQGSYSRSLLSCEALEEDLGVTVDAQVVDRGSIWGGARAVGFTGDVAEESGASRAALSRESLHVDVCVEKSMLKK